MLLCPLNVTWISMCLRGPSGHKMSDVLTVDRDHVFPQMPKSGGQYTLKVTLK